MWTTSTAPSPRFFSTGNWTAWRPWSARCCALACAEVDGFADIPPRVTLNEYIELAKYYSGGQAPGFINGVLDKLVHLKGKPDAGVPQVRIKDEG